MREMKDSGIEWIGTIPFDWKCCKQKTSAKNNTEQDFEFSFYDNTDDALIEGLSQNQDFFSLLLSNDDIKHRVLGVFLHEVYKELREQP